MAAFPLPFLTLPDPKASGEGALDPLGLASIADRLANWILPGMTNRTYRPRFLTAMTLSSVICEGLHEQLARDSITHAYLIFEWLVVEAFARTRDARDFSRTPGIDKARAAVNAGAPLCAMSYLKTPSVFGFHGVYSRLARHLGIVDDESLLGDNGYALFKVWESEQQVKGLAEKQLLRSAVVDGLKNGHSSRSPAWQGWQFIADHLAPAEIGEREAGFIRELLLDPKGDKREEIFRLVSKPANLRIGQTESEAALARHLLQQSSEELARRLKTIEAYERVCALAEEAFLWLRFLSSRNPTRALTPADFGSQREVQRIVALLPRRLKEAQNQLRDAPHEAEKMFDHLGSFLDQADSAERLFEALLDRHAQVQKLKPPEGKREWFERAADIGVFVRPPYRLDEMPHEIKDWGRPYRLKAVIYFCRDLDAAW